MLPRFKDSLYEEWFEMDLKGENCLQELVMCIEEKWISLQWALDDVMAILYNCFIPFIL